MKKVSLFILCIIALNCAVAQNNNSANTRGVTIINGEDVLIENHPYQADLGGCGGTIIGPTWILTAEHCIGGAVSVGSSIGVGYTKRSDKSTGQTAKIKKIYNFQCTGYCDLSLLELTSPLDLSGQYAKSIRYADELVFNLGYVKNGGDCYATGWGQLDPYSGQTPDNLQGALLRFDIVKVTDSRLRVNETEGRLVCRGDSGGPLVVENGNSEKILVGAVSGGEGEPCSDYGLWGNVINASDWIEQTTGIPPYAESTVSTNDYANEILEIWPNPAKDVLSITTSTNKPLNNIRVFNMAGKEVLRVQERINIIPVGSLGNGMYILHSSDISTGHLFVVGK